MKKYVKKISGQIVSVVGKYTKPEADELVMRLVLHTAALALPKGHSVEFAPIKGTCGNIQLTGNSHPVFTYRVFEKTLMEFIQVRVEVSKPDRIHFISTIDSTTDLEAHGKEVETTEKYKEPFFTLSGHLYHYFPFTRSKDTSNVII